MKNIALCLILLSAGCAHSPARWSAQAIDMFRCNMPESELRELLKPELEMFAGRQSGWATHFSRQGNTMLYFGVEQRELKSYQLFTFLWKGVKARDRVILCA